MQVLETKHGLKTTLMYPQVQRNRVPRRYWTRDEPLVQSEAEFPRFSSQAVELFGTVVLHR